jgi:predicted AAA+ superfamily ATPase
MSDERFPHAYSSVLAELARRLSEPPPGRVQVVAGPRQVGKTHLLRAIEERWQGRAIYAAADVPAAALPGWWDAQWHEVERLATARGAAVLLVDEIQYLPGWARRLKAETDRVLHRRVPVHVVVSGSSSLRVGQGTRETMAGRFERLEIRHWPARELARQLGLDEDVAVATALRLGTYPGAVPFTNDGTRWASYVRDAIIEPAVGRDIMALEVIRRPALLRQVFALAAGHPAEIVSLQKLQGALVDRGALETIAHYLAVLQDAYLTAPVEKFTVHAVRRRAAPPKLIVLNQGILAALSDVPPEQPIADPRLWGRWVENACLAAAWNAGQTVNYWRQEPLEVDMVLTGSWGRWAVEVKTGPFGARDLAGLLAFCRLHPDYRPLCLCEPGHERGAKDAGILACPVQRFLLDGPPD